MNLDGGLNVIEDNKISLEIKKVSENAIIPQYQTTGAAGFDFHSTDDKIIIPGDTALISTGLAFSVPRGFELQVRPRSGLSAKTGLRVANAPGTVDSDFRGEVKIIITNTGNLPQSINKGDRIAQGVLCPVYQGLFLVVDDLDSTERGEKGFGSTGL
jgi:dUTP pyrophosphatase